MSAIRSAFYSLLNKGLIIVLNIAGLAVLGRLLSPKEFGIFGIVVATESLFLPVLDMGLTPAFIKLETETQEASNAFFSVNVLLGFLVALMLVFLSPILVYIYGQKQLLQLTQVFALSIIIRSLSRQPVANLIRNKRFDKILIINQIALVAGILTAIITAWIGFGVWALMLRVIVQGLTLTLTAYLVTNNSYAFVGLSVIKKYKESFRLGCGIVISRFMGGLSNSIDKLLFGKLFSIDLLGHYNRAFSLATIPNSNIRTALTTPALAHFARMANTKQWGNYLLMCNIVLLLVGLPCIFFIVLGDRLLPWLMGSQWIRGGVFLQLLGVWCLGKILQGLGVVIYTNELKIKDWVKVNSIAPVFIFSATIGFYLIFNTAYSFVLALSLSNFIFWNLAIALFLKKHTSTWELSFRVLQTQATILLSALIFLLLKGLFVKDIFTYLHSETAGIILCVIVITLGSMFFQFLFNYKQIREVYLYFQERLKNTK